METGTPIPGRNGGTLSAGNPGNKGGGRTSNEARRMIREAITPEHVAEVARMAESGASDDIKLRAFKVMADIGIAKELEVTTRDGEQLANDFFAALAQYPDGTPFHFDEVAQFVRDRMPSA